MLITKIILVFSFFSETYQLILIIKKNYVLQ